jgi:hypothetical protein
MKTRVKGFQAVLGLNKAHSEPMGRNLALEIEEQVNAFLDARPKVVVRELRLSAHAAPFDQVTTNYALFAMLLYEE